MDNRFQGVKDRSIAVTADGHAGIDAGAIMDLMMKQKGIGEEAVGLGIYFLDAWPQYMDVSQPMPDFMPTSPISPFSDHHMLQEQDVLRTQEDAFHTQPLPEDATNEIYVPLPEYRPLTYMSAQEVHELDLRGTDVTIWDLYPSLPSFLGCPRMAHEGPRWIQQGTLDAILSPYGG